MIKFKILPIHIYKAISELEAKTKLPQRMIIHSMI